MSEQKLEVFRDIALEQGKKLKAQAALIEQLTEALKFVEERYVRGTGAYDPPAADALLAAERWMEENK